MTGVKETDRKRFEEITGNADGWATIGDLVKLCDQADYWSAEFDGRATLEAKKAHIRRIIKKVKDERQWPVWASLETTNEEGKAVQIYKQETLFDIEDYRKVTTYHAGRASYHSRMARGYAKRCDKRFKTRLYRQLRIDFDDESADPKKPR